MDTALKDAAEWYYDVCGLYEYEDIDPDDAVAVLKRAFTSYDCGYFAYALNCLTGFPVHNMTCEHGLMHSVVRHPDGRYLDVCGWVTPEDLCRRYGVTQCALSPVEPEYALGCILGDDVEDGIDTNLSRVVSVIRALPYSPFSDEIRLLIKSTSVEGVDYPDGREVKRRDKSDGPSL